MTTPIMRCHDVLFHLASDNGLLFTFMFQRSNVYLKRCYLSMYNANQDFLESFSMLKLMDGGQVHILFTTFAFNESTRAAEGYIETDRVPSSAGIS